MGSFAACNPEEALCGFYELSNVLTDAGRHIGHDPARQVPRWQPTEGGTVDGQQPAARIRGQSGIARPVGLAPGSQLGRRMRGCRLGIRVSLASRSGSGSIRTRYHCHGLWLQVCREPQNKAPGFLGHIADLVLAAKASNINNTCSSLQPRFVPAPPRLREACAQPYYEYHDQYHYNLGLLWLVLSVLSD